MTQPNIVTWFGQDLKEWTHGGKIKVSYRPTLDGGGSFEAGWYLNFFRKRYPERKFKKAFEWCSGPGFIGFSLLEAGICQKLCLADINEAAIDCARRTIEVNRLSSEVSCYVSDNFRQIPEHEQFDLIVANPPYYKQYNPNYVVNASSTLRSSDPDWNLRRDFYANVGRYLSKDALLCISEYLPLEGALESGPRGPIDLRDRVPIDEFIPMIKRAGLRLKEVVLAEGEPVLQRITDGMPASPAFQDCVWILVIERSTRA